MRGAFSAGLGELLGHGRLLAILLVTQASNRREVGVARRRRDGRRGEGLAVALDDVRLLHEVRDAEARGRDDRLHLLDRWCTRRWQRRRRAGALLVAQAPDRSEVGVARGRARYRGQQCRCRRVGVVAVRRQRCPRGVRAGAREELEARDDRAVIC